MTQMQPKMSKAEMIDTLKGLVFGSFDRTTPKEREALDGAISALEAQELEFRCDECVHHPDRNTPFAQCGVCKRNYKDYWKRDEDDESGSDSKS